MIVKPIEIDWNADMPVFANETFLKAVSHKCGWLGGFDGEDKLRCILPYTVVNKLVLKLVRFRVEIIPVGGNLALEEERSFLNQAVEFFKATGADAIIPATTNTIFRTYPENADAAPYGTYFLDLSLPEEDLWSNMSNSHKRRVRQAVNQGVEIKSGLEYVDTAHRIVRETFRRSSIPFMNLQSFRRMIGGLGDHVDVMAAVHEGVVQACIVIPFSRYAAYYVYGGSIEGAINGSMNLLHWEAVRRYRELGVKRYDFVGVRIDPEPGSKQEGLKIFKERFGGELARGYMWKCPLRPMKYRLYCLAAKWRTGGDIVDAERKKLKKGL